MDHTPGQPDEPRTPPPSSPPPPPGGRGDADDGYSLSPEDDAPTERPRPLKSIGSLTDGVDIDAASDEKAVLRSATRSTHTRFDHETGRRKPRVLTDPETGENSLRSDEGPIVAQGKMGWKGPAIVAATLFVVTMVLTGVAATRDEFWRAMGYQLLHIPINIGLGMAALIALKVLAERPMGYWKGGLARVAAAVCAFHAVMALDLDFALAGAVLWLSGALVYAAILRFTTRTSVKETFVLAFAHFLLWGFVQLVFWIAPMVRMPEGEPEVVAPIDRPPAQIDRASPPAP